MLVAERHKRIVDIVNERGSVSVLALSKKLMTSEVTIRKDLGYLHSLNLVVRTRGGAISPGFSHHIVKYHELDVICQKEKKIIAEAAFQFITEGETILLDGSTTVAELAKLIAQKRYRLKIYTTSLKVCELFLKNNGECSINIIGGRINKDMGTAEGLFAIDQLEKLSVQRCFFGINGIDNNGYTVAREEEAHIKRCFRKAAKESYLLADNTKFGRRYLVKALDINTSPNNIITDYKRSDFDYTKIEKHTHLTFAKTS